MKRIKWIDHIINFFIVLTSVSIAFWLDGYRNDLQNRKIEHRNLRGIMTDVSEDIEVLDSIINLYEKTIDNYDFLLKDYIPNGKEYYWGRDTVVLNKFFDESYWVNYTWFSPKNITYESIKISGRLDIITNSSLKNAIINLNYKTYRDLRERNYGREKTLEWYREEKARVYKGYYSNSGNDYVLFFQPKLNKFMEREKHRCGYEIEYYSRIRSECQDLIQMIKKELG